MLVLADNLTAPPASPMNKEGDQKEEEEKGQNNKENVTNREKEKDGTKDADETQVSGQEVDEEKDNYSEYLDSDYIY